jgi:hypothetical protein
MAASLLPASITGQTSDRVAAFADAGQSASETTLNLVHTQSLDRSSGVENSTV